MVLKGMRRPDGSLKAFVYAVLVHVVVIGILMIGFRWQTRPANETKVMQARMLDDSQLRAEVEKFKLREAQKQQALEAQQRRQQETLEAEKNRRTEQARQEELKRRAAEEKMRAAAEEKKRQEAALKKKQSQAAQQRREAESALKEQLLAEERQRDQQKQAQTTSLQAAELARYEGLIRQKVERNWVRPFSTQQGMECIVRVRLVASGEVMEAVVVRGSGNAAFDRSVESAVYKASPLPLPEDKNLFEHFRLLELRFKPEE